MTSGRRPYLLKRGEGESVWSLGGRFTVKVADADSEGRFALVEALAFRSAEPPLHLHHNEASEGSFVFAPSGLAHTFAERFGIEIVGPPHRAHQ